MFRVYSMIRFQVAGLGFRGYCAGSRLKAYLMTDPEVDT